MIEVPDKLYKLLVLIGVALIGFGYLTFWEKRDKYLQDFEKAENANDVLSSIDAQVGISHFSFKRAERRLSQINEIDSVYYIDSNEFVVNRKSANYSEWQEEVNFLASKYGELQKLKSESAVLRKKARRLEARLNSADFEFRFWKSETGWSKWVGIFFFSVGVFWWGLEALRTHRNRIHQYEKTYSYCQSCGEKFNAVRINGKNKDGTYNNAFCKFCFKKGKFREPELTVEISRERFLSGRSKLKGWWKDKIQFLERWDRRNP